MQCMFCCWEYQLLALLLFLCSAKKARFGLIPFPIQGRRPTCPLPFSKLCPSNSPWPFLKRTDLDCIRISCLKFGLSLKKIQLDWSVFPFITCYGPYLSGWPWVGKAQLPFRQWSNALKLNLGAGFIKLRLIFNSYSREFFRLNLRPVVWSGTSLHPKSTCLDNRLSLEL